MTYEDVLAKIRQKGYWRILFEPLAEENISLGRCKELVEKNVVELRGWDYPHIPRRLGDDTGYEPGNNYWQGWLDWPPYAHYEFWRFYQSTQFIHYIAIAQDWQENVAYKNMWSHDKVLPPGEYLGALGTVYQLTEVYQFLSKLAQDGLYKQGASVTIELHNTQNRKLYVDDYSRMPFSTEKKTASKLLNFQKNYTHEDMIKNARELATEAILHFFERFQWEPSKELIVTDQEKLITRKL